MAEQLSKRLCQDPTQLYEEQAQVINPNEIRKAILHDLTEPLVFRGYLSTFKCEDEHVSQWKCMQWDASDWVKLFEEKVLKFRVGMRLKDKTVLSAPQWETACYKANMTYSEFLQWSQGKRSCTTFCNQEVNCNDHWAYFDYFYMKDIENVNQVEGALDWGLFGFPDRGVQDSTLWIGTTGANTPCHIDTYGCNLVAQLIGRKRWVLFPRTQSEYLSPTRIPYEESSIYSEVGFPHPSVASHPKLISSTPYVFTLEPGDVLFVPKQWWHFVENLDFAVSINTWLELPSDHEERVKESLVMYQVASLCQGLESLDLISSVFNPNMLDVATMTSSELLKLLTKRVFKNSVPRETTAAKSNCEEVIREKPMRKQSLITKDCNLLLDRKCTDFNWKDEKWCANHNIEKVCSMSFLDYMHLVFGPGSGNCCMETEVSMKKRDSLTKAQDANSRDDDDDDINFSQIKLLVDSFTDQRVISILKMVIDEKLAEN
nr:HSPB1-associated protein 1-like isoform X2 [Procambarus clarkii]